VAQAHPVREVPRKTLYCSRCDDAVSALMPWHGWKNALRGWAVGVGVLAVLSPFWSVDWCIMIPSAFAYLVAGSVLLRLSREKPVCSVCSLDLDDAHGGTGVRARPAR
jgi:hypothetical protein